MLIKRLYLHFVLVAAVGIAFAPGGCDGDTRPSTYLHVILDTSGSVPPSGREALDQEMRRVLTGDWAMRAAPGSSITLWAFTSDPTYPASPLLRFTLTKEQLRPPVVESRRAAQKALNKLVSAALAAAEYGVRGSPIAESIRFIAEARTGAEKSADLVVISDFLQTSPDGATDGIAFTESRLRAATDEELLRDLQQTGAANACIRRALLVSTYGISDLATRRAVPPNLQQRALTAFRSWLEWLGCEVEVRTVLPSAPDAATGSVEPQRAGGGGHDA